MSSCPKGPAAISHFDREIEKERKKVHVCAFEATVTRGDTRTRTSSLLPQTELAAFTQRVDLRGEHVFINWRREREKKKEYARDDEDDFGHEQRRGGKKNTSEALRLTHNGLSKSHKFFWRGDRA